MTRIAKDLAAVAANPRRPRELRAMTRIAKDLTAVAANPRARGSAELRDAAD